MNGRRNAFEGGSFENRYRFAAEVVKAAMEKGVLCLTAKDKVRLLPALNIPFDELKCAIDIIKEVAK